MNVPEKLKYTSDHEWVAVDGEILTVGITDHAQAELSDVVFVELPSVGMVVGSGDNIAVVESVKAASDIYAPTGGEVVEINTEIEGDPSVLNGDPYGAGWLFKLKASDSAEVEDLLDAGGYEDLLA